jgi:predicted amidophosphoribosyltransferase
VRDVARSALDLLLPATCAGCGAHGSACCPSCALVWGNPRPVARGNGGAGPALYALAPYSGVARRLVLSYKERNRRDLAQPLAARLASALPYLPEAEADDTGAWWIVPVPSRRAAARARGGSHMLRLARECAAAMAAAGRIAMVAPALELAAGVRESVGLDRAARQANLGGRVRVSWHGLPCAGKSAVLLDDVITTGVTAFTCARVLEAAGVRVSAVLALTSAGR